MRLNGIKDNPGAKKTRVRIGRGIGSGLGKMGGRGGKGQTARTGVAIGGFEGGQMPLHRRLPKRGFTNIFREEWAIINVSTLEKLEGASFDPDTLKKLGVVKKMQKGLKVLGTGDIKKAVTVKAHAISEAAKQKIEAAGGKVELIGAA
jgi:large subunit ribosomal protein L15